MIASIGISKGMLDKTFTTRNTLVKDKKIKLELVDGPFKQLTGYWEFQPLKTDNACKVLLKLDYEFDNVVLSMTAGPVFKQIANSLVDAFCKRATEVYGRHDKNY